MAQTNRNSGGGNNDSHHLIQLHEAPESLIALRQELVYHPDITNYAQNGKTFEECLGIIALHLDIALDGIYDCEPLCKVLVTALKNRRIYPNSPHLRAQGLLDIELVEKEGSLEVVERDRSVFTNVSEETIITNTTVQTSFAIQTGEDAKPVGDSGTTSEGSGIGDTKTKTDV